MDKIACQMQECHKTNFPRQIRPQHAWQDFANDLKTSLRPTELLFLISLHLGWQLSRDDHIRKIVKFPAAHLGSIAQVEVFSQSIPLPAAGILNASPAPQSCCPVEIKKEAVLGTDRLLDDEMT